MGVRVLKCPIGVGGDRQPRSWRWGAPRVRRAGPRQPFMVTLGVLRGECDSRKHTERSLRHPQCPSVVVAAPRVQYEKARDSKRFIHAQCQCTTLFDPQLLLPHPFFAIRAELSKYSIDTYRYE